MDRRKHLAASLALCIVTLALPCAAWAEIIYVDDDANAPGDGSSWQTAYKYLQDALMDAGTTKEPVEMRVAQGIYKPDRSAVRPEGTLDRAATFHLLNGLTLQGGFAGVGTPDPNARDLGLWRTILSGDLRANDAQLSNPLAARTDPTRKDNSYHVVSFNERGEIDADLTAELDGLVIISGQAQRYKADGHAPWMGTPPEHGGGGLHLWSVQGRTVKLSVRDCVFERNYAEEMGGAVYCSIEGIRFENCRFTRNATHMCGGAAYPSARSAEFAQCRFENNCADGDGGGGIYCSAQETMLTDCMFIGNRASIYGGGMHIASYGTVRCSNCSWEGNSVMHGGGGICVFGGLVEASNCRFIGNRSREAAGALMVNGFATLKLANCVLSGNAAENDGGVLWNICGVVRFVNCTARGNRAGLGAFLFDHTFEMAPSAVDIINCILHNGENEVWNNYGAVMIRYSDMPSGRAGIHDPRGLAVWGPGNIEVDPCFADSGHWDPNGTPEDPNDDFFVEGDYHLKSQAGRWDPAAESWAVDEATSRCIDAGDPNIPIGEEPFPNGGRVNMGAYGGTGEASKSYSEGPVCETVIAGDISGDGRVDWADLRIWVLHWLEKGNPESIIEPDIGK